MRTEALSGTLRRRHFYSVPDAGAMIDLGRTQSYKAARRGQIPAERHGKFFLVPRGSWNRIVRRLRQARRGRSRKAKQQQAVEAR